MEKRIFGPTGHMSTVAIFGGAAFWDIPQEQADVTFEKVVKAGVNHIDVAPSYGKAEILIGPWMKKMRSSFFLGCKTMEREKDQALAEANRSLQRLQTENFDLYQCHAVTDLEELDKITQKGGALEALIDLKQRDLTRFLGITSHGLQAPSILLEALNRFNFDSVLFPLNFILSANEKYRADALKLIDYCTANDVGMMVIKSIARGKWGEHKQTHTTWYQPLTDVDEIQMAINFVLTHAVTGICTAGDINILPTVLEACSQYTKLTSEEVEKTIEKGPAFVAEPLF